MKLSDFGPFVDSFSSFSLEGDDKIAASLLRSVLDIHDKSHPFYLDIGANDPVAASNTNLFYTLGYFGLCVDPLPRSASRFRVCRPNDIFLPYALASFSGHSEFAVYAEDGASGMHDETVKRYDQKFERTNTLSVDVLTFSQLTDMECFGGIKVLPLLSIDIEGLDEQVLLGILESDLRFDLIIIEDKNISLHSPFPHSSIGHILCKFGYTFIAKTPLNSFWISNHRNSYDWLPASMLS